FHERIAAAVRVPDPGRAGGAIRQAAGGHRAGDQLVGAECGAGRAGAGVDPEAEVRRATVVSGGGDVAHLRWRMAAVRTARPAPGLVATAYGRIDPGLRPGQHRLHGLPDDPGAAWQGRAGAGGGGRPARCVPGAGVRRHRGGVDLFRAHAAAAVDAAPRPFISSIPGVAAGYRGGPARRLAELAGWRVRADRSHADPAGAVFGRAAVQVPPGPATTRRRGLGAGLEAAGGPAAVLADRDRGRRKRPGAHGWRAAGGDGADGVGGDPGRRVRPGTDPGQYRAGRRHRAVVADGTAGQPPDRWRGLVMALAYGLRCIETGHGILGSRGSRHVRL